MCCCGRPTRNDELGYRWQPNDRPSIAGVNPPELQDSETLLFDEPGRCGGQDSHSHHYRVISRAASLWLLVRHGGGDERMRLSNPDAVKAALQALDSNGRYWVLGAIFHAQRDAETKAQQATAAIWRQAAAEKRIKTRKLPSRGIVKVWIKEKTA